MAPTVVIILTFLFPAAVITMVWYWTRNLRREVVQEKDKHNKLVSLLEKVISTKDTTIKMLREKIGL